MDIYIYLSGSGWIYCSCWENKFDEVFFEREIGTFPDITKVEQELENNNNYGAEQDPSYEVD